MATKRHRSTRLVTSDIDGKDLYNLCDDGMVSHCCWKDDGTILAYARKIDLGNGYYLMKDKSPEWERIFTQLKLDGHPSYSYDGHMLITDTYPDRARVASLFLKKDGSAERVARVFSSFKYDNDTRCDLHPRWNRAEDKVCFDSVF